MPKPAPQPALPQEPVGDPGPGSRSPDMPQMPQTPPEPDRDRPARRFSGLVRTAPTGVLAERLNRPQRKTLLGE